MAEPTLFRVEGKIVGCDKARTFNGEELANGIDVKLDIAGTKKPATWRVSNVSLDEAQKYWMAKTPVEISGPLDIRENKEATRIYVGPGVGTLKALSGNVK